MTKGEEMDQFYGTEAPNEAGTEIDHIVELVRLRGFAELPNLLSQEQIQTFCNRIDAVYESQEADFGRERLQKIGEVNLARCPLAFDSTFLDLFLKDKVLDVVRAVLGSYFVLHLQNGIIVHPNRVHHQSAWHRDLPYQEYVSSRPLALNVFVCLHDFTHETGGTMFLPFSHRSEKLPSQGVLETLATQPEVPAGSAIVFDSMVFHRAGHNVSDAIRRGINHVFTTGVLRQQIDLPRWLPTQNLQMHHRALADQELRMILGYDAHTADSVRAYRQRRLDRL